MAAQSSLNGPAVRIAFSVVVLLSIGGLLGWKVYEGAVVEKRQEELIRKEMLEHEKRRFAPVKATGQAPDFALADRQGKVVKLGDFSGKYLMVNFWATYCEPCLVELPSMFSLAEKYKGANFEIVTISLDQGWQDVDRLWDKTLKGAKPPFTVLLDTEGEVAAKYGTRKIPETYIVDPQGRLLDKFIAERDWSSEPADIYFSKLLGDKSR